MFLHHPGIYDVAPFQIPALQAMNQHLSSGNVGCQRNVAHITQT
ncbi:hypothetical protein EVA_14982 [gut metagenome]|uniref:Uncharacterized protein n=1 Tax=gut metagenome TaxID=749906 RepID=J9G516_9ZZZZ